MKARFRKLAANRKGRATRLGKPARVVQRGSGSWTGRVMRAAAGLSRDQRRQVPLIGTIPSGFQCAFPKPVTPAGRSRRKPWGAAGRAASQINKLIYLK